MITIKSVAFLLILKYEFCYQGLYLHITYIYYIFKYKYLLFVILNKYLIKNIEYSLIDNTNESEISLIFFLGI